MGRRNDHSKEELERLILDNAYKIIGDEGLEALTARRLAKDIGYAPGTIYNLFHSMDDLILILQGKTLDHLYTLLSSSENVSKSHNLC
jgi:AcrR family transcriptional regulator